MGTISEKLVYLNGTKQAIKQAINEDFEVIDNNTTFREYAAEISSNNAKYKDLIPKETKNATNTLDISNSAGLDKALVTQYGNTYQEGEPTPDYPQEIQVVSGDNTIEVVGKNLFDYNDLVSKIQTFTITGTANNFTTTGYGTYQYPISISTDEIISGSWSTTNLNGDVKVIYEDDTSKNIFSSYTSSSASGTISFIPTKKVKAIQFRTFNSNNNITITNFQIEKGSTATTYEPYQSQSYPINLGNIELCKIGDYQDSIVKDNGKWYWHREIEKVVLNGSESNWNIGVSSNFYRAEKIFNILPYTDTSRHIGRFVCSHFYPNTNNEIGAIFQYQSTVLFYVPSGITTVEQWKTWLGNNNTTLYYVLATPTTEEITESNYPTLYNQLNNIKLFEGVNHITMTNESGLDVEFDITYYKDWKLD